LPDKLRALAAWRARVAGLYGSAPQREIAKGEIASGEIAKGEVTQGVAVLDHDMGEADGPVIRVLTAAAAEFRLREEDFAAVIDGMRMDAETVIVAPDLVTLDLYCDRVASAVGRLSVRAFGDSSDEADKVAYFLGRALQLTNILRDIKEDADRGRLYLPAEYLDAAGVPHDPAAALASPALPVVCARLAADAHEHFRNVRAHMANCDPVAMKPARLMGATYAAILTCLEQSKWRDPATRISLPLWRKSWLLIRYGFG
jgi:phytoene/squalene synthetase